MSDEERQQLLAIVSGLVSLGAILLAGVLQSNPEALRDLWYRWRIWQAYRDTSVNFDRLRYIRRQIDAGTLDDDLEGEVHGAS